MNIFETVLFYLSGKTEMPAPFGLFHIVCLLITIAAAVFLCVKLKDAPPKTEKILLMILWGVLVVMETYKQLLYAAHFTGAGVRWVYQWNSFPFQFCSSPLYLFPLAALPRSERFRDIIRMFLATFSLFAGLVVMIYPKEVFSSFIGINVQTMLHHGTMVVMGVYLGGRLVREKKMTLRRFLQSGVVFIILLAIALVLNLFSPMFTREVFNMFFISPHYPCTLAILDLLYPVAPYPLFLLTYIVGFTAVAFLMFCLQMVLRPSWHKSRKEKSDFEN